MSDRGAPGGTGLRLAILPFAFAGGAVAAGVAVSWVTTYVLVPTEDKWAQSPETPFLISCLFSVLLAVVGGGVFGISAALLVLKAKRSLPKWPTWQAAASGVFYSVAILGGGDTLVRMGAGDLVGPGLIWPLAAGVPVLLSLFRYRRSLA